MILITLLILVIKELKMQKRFDYHSVAALVKLLFFVWVVFLLIYLSIFFNGKTPPLSDLISIITFLFIGIFVSIAAYVHLKRTYIEISDDGILYNGWRKKIFSPWQSVREIKILGRKHKIYTINGNFSIGYLELSDNPSKGQLGLIKKERRKISGELIEEIKKQAPHAKITYSIFLRPL